MNKGVQLALRNLYQDYVQQFQAQHGSLPFSPWQEDWDSPCIQQVDRHQERTYWLPAEREDEQPLPEVEKGLEIAVHPDIRTFYGSLWADGIRVDSPWGEIGLIQVWNPEDLELLKQNQLGHAFVRLKQRSPLSFFIGIQQDEKVISIDNDRGVVQREQPGRRRKDEVLCDSLENFLRQLRPNLRPYGEF